MKKFQKLTAWILTLDMLMTFIPATLTVNAKEAVVSVIVGGVTTNYTDIEKLCRMQRQFKITIQILPKILKLR